MKNGRITGNNGRIVKDKVFTFVKRLKISPSPAFLSQNLNKGRKHIPLIEIFLWVTSCVGVYSPWLNGPFAD